MTTANEIKICGTAITNALKSRTILCDLRAMHAVAVEAYPTTSNIYHREVLTWLAVQDVIDSLAATPIFDI